MVIMQVGLKYLSKKKRYFVYAVDRNDDLPLVFPEQSSEKDQEFNASDESEEDVEDTIAAQEKRERKTQNHAEELADLEAEGDLTVEELYLKYAAAYTEDFNPDMSDRSTDVEDATSGSSEEEGMSYRGSGSPPLLEIC